MRQNSPAFALASGRLHREDGQAAFEFVLMFPVFIFLLFAIFDIGVLMYEYVSVSNAAREGARFAAVNCSTVAAPAPACTVSKVQSKVVERSGGILKASPGCPTAPTTSADPDMICVNWIDPATGTARTGSDFARRGDAAVVSVNHMYGLLFLPIHFPVVSCASMRLERPDDTAVSPGTGALTC